MVGNIKLNLEPAKKPSPTFKRKNLKIEKNKEQLELHMPMTKEKPMPTFPSQKSPKE
jgi:hypothetical protein